MQEPSSQFRTLAPGDVLEDKYKILGVLGEGGMGVVYLAEHLLLGEQVAIKTVHAAQLVDASVVTRFVNEARAAARLKTEHVVRIYDVGQSREVGPFMVMDVLEGQTLADYLDARGPLTAREAADLVLPVLEALAMAHAAGIVHRDLKPANLFLAKEGRDRSVIKVLDFGIAKAAVDAHAHPSVTSTQTMMGSPLYMSPEQAKSAKRAEPRSDLWSMGVVLYELVTKEVPFSGETVGEVIANIVGEEPRNVRTLAPQLPEAFASLIHEGLLAKDLNRRFAGAAQLAEALAPFASPHLAAYVARVRDASAPRSSRRSVDSSPNLTGPTTDPGLDKTAAAEPSGSLAVAPAPVAPAATPPPAAAAVSKTIDPRPAPRTSARGKVALAVAAVVGVTVVIGALAIVGKGTRGGHGGESSAAVAPPAVASVPPAIPATTDTAKTDTPTAGTAPVEPPTPTSSAVASGARNAPVTGPRPGAASRTTKPSPSAVASAASTPSAAPSSTGLSSTRQAW